MHNNSVNKPSCKAVEFPSRNVCLPEMAISHKQRLSFTVNVWQSRVMDVFSQLGRYFAPVS